MIASASPEALEPKDDALDAAAWAAVRAVRHGATPPAHLRSHPLLRMLGPTAAPRNLVVAQIGQSLDGRVATVTGASHYINGPGGLDHLHRLRALVEAVVVGVGTVCADDCQLTVRRVEGVSPARVVIDPAGRMPAGARLLADDGTRRIVIRAEGAPHCAAPGVETVHLPAVAGRIEPRDVVAALARRGLRRVLIEGGASTVSAFIEADLVDRLHVMVAPLLVGSGRAGLALTPIDRLDLARRPVAAAFTLGEDILFDCDMRRSAQNRRAEGGVSHDADGLNEDARSRRLHADG
ncbi:RibD family protein [Methylopila sp. Yamaguchi]|uniref:RibD family protein n=1 Tax=Methylopila sp. Yamaguchi TaxID=1437817 RepID=UPI000CC0AF4D|nr:RibD family protein [Methylopila sp. Yamaguchi]GBD50731.1 bifunctional deaminase-reductase domain-containing protein [Methylopila sp. Yamaguchi]